MSNRLSSPLAHARGIDFGAIRAEFALTEVFGADVLAEASGAVDAHAQTRVDRRDLALVTIDPPGAMDLDQAVQLEARGDGYRVHYAIADVGALVLPGGALDAETRRRGQTRYFPDGSVPLHPRELSEASGSLLPDRDRAAVLWTLDLDARGELVATSLVRALVKSVARLDYVTVQAAADAGALHPSIALLPRIGALRGELSRARGAVNLELPEQEVVPGARAGEWELRIEPRTAADGWNAEISLLTGHAAAEIMLSGGVGMVRTLPAPADRDIDRLRAAAAALSVPWDHDVNPGAFLAGLDPAAPTTLALMSVATKLLRGSGYAAFDVAAGAAAPADPRHAGVASTYAHVTAPLRRLGDRFVTEICLALHAGTEIPEWARAGLTALPEIMKRTDGESNRADRACVDLTEATLLKNRIGDTFDAVVVRDDLRGPDRNTSLAEVFVPELATIAPAAPGGAVVRGGDRVGAVVTAADPGTRTVAFRIDGQR